MQTKSKYITLYSFVFLPKKSGLRETIIVAMTEAEAIKIFCYLFSPEPYQEKTRRKWEGDLCELFSIHTTLKFIKKIDGFNQITLGRFDSIPKPVNIKRK